MPNNKLRKQNIVEKAKDKKITFLKKLQFPPKFPAPKEQEELEFSKWFVLSIFVGLPTQFVVLLFALTMHYVVYLQREQFAFVGDWVDVNLFWGFWFTGTVMYITQVLMYTLCVFHGKAQIKYYILFSSALALILAEQAVVMNRSIYFIEHHSVYALLFSTIMLAVFTLFTIMCNKFTKIKERNKIILSFSAALLLGLGLSYAAWMFVFSMLHGI